MVLFFLLTTVIIVGGYSLLLSNRILFGDLNRVSLEFLSDINLREILISSLLVFFVIFLGVRPSLITETFNDPLILVLKFIYQY